MGEVGREAIEYFSYHHGCPFGFVASSVVWVYKTELELETAFAEGTKISASLAA